MNVIKASMILRSRSSVLSRLFSTRPLGDVAASGRVPRSPDALEWLVVIPDRPSVIQRRIAVRPKHSLNFVKLHQEGYVSWGVRHEGPLFENHVDKGQPRPFKGSAMVLNDQSKEGVLKMIASDIYVQEGVWALEKALIVPFRTIMRRELLNGRSNARGDQ